MFSQRRLSRRQCKAKGGKEPGNELTFVEGKDVEEQKPNWRAHRNTKGGITHLFSVFNHWATSQQRQKAEVEVFGAGKFQPWHVMSLSPNQVVSPCTLALGGSSDPPPLERAEVR